MHASPRLPRRPRRRPRGSQAGPHALGSEEQKGRAAPLPKPRTTQPPPAPGELGAPPAAPRRTGPPGAGAQVIGPGDRGRPLQPPKHLAAAFRPPAAEKPPNPPALLMSGPRALLCTVPELPRRLPGASRQCLAAKNAAANGTRMYSMPHPGPGHQGTHRDPCSRLDTSPWMDGGPRLTPASTSRPGCGGHRGERVGEASHPGPPGNSTTPRPTDPLWAGDPRARGAAASRATRPPAPPFPAGSATPSGPPHGSRLGSRVGLRSRRIRPTERPAMRRPRSSGA